MKIHLTAWTRHVLLLSQRFGVRSHRYELRLLILQLSICLILYILYVSFVLPVLRRSGVAHYYIGVKILHINVTVFINHINVSGALKVFMCVSLYTCIYNIILC